MKLEFARQSFGKKTQISSLIKIRLVGAELFLADRQTDMTKVLLAFRNFANTPKNTHYRTDMPSCRAQRKLPFYV